MNSCLKIIIYLSLAILSSCSGVNGPINLEPVLIIQDAKDITRNNCVVGVKIKYRGTGKLDYVKFHYGEGNLVEVLLDPGYPDPDSISVKLQNLKAGTTYSYYAEGGTGSVCVKSELRSFTTDSNNCPSLGDTKILAVGPVGVYIGYDITDDGGEDITEAGCIIKDLKMNSEVRYYYDPEDCFKGEHQMYILGLMPETWYTVTPFAANKLGESIGKTDSFITNNSIILFEPGQFSKLFGDDPLSIDELTITGELNGDDLHKLRRLLGAPSLLGETKNESRLENVNLLNVNIVAGGGPYDGSHFTENDVISAGMFSECYNLKSIELPFSTVSILKDSFKDCINLKSLKLPSNVSALLPSSGCTSLECIEVEKGNKYFNSLDGVLFNNDITEIIWFPLGKNGAYELPATIAIIKENAFIGTKIVSLTIPSSVTIIERGAFSGSTLQEITLPETLKNISEGLFQNCTNLKVVRMGKDTEFLGDYVFDNCELEHIYLPAEFPPFVSENCFYNNKYNIFENCVLHVPSSSKPLYRNHNLWKKFQKIEIL